MEAIDVSMHSDTVYSMRCRRSNMSRWNNFIASPIFIAPKIHGRVRLLKQ